MTNTTLDNQTLAAAELPKPKTQVHLNYLDGMRALAALYVVLFHAAFFQEIFPTGIVLTLTSWLLYGHFAVDVFIVISGFSLMLPVVRGDGKLRGGYWGFMKRRAKRILPPYYFALLYALILATTIIKHATDTAWVTCVPVTWQAVVTHLLLIHNLSDQTMFLINGPFWSIAVEWQLYFVFPLLVLGWSRIGAIKTVIAATIIGYCALVALRHTEMQGITPQYLALFSFGMLGATISFSEQPAWQRLRRPWLWKLAATALVVFDVLLCRHYNDYHIVQTHAGLADFFIGLSTVSLLILLSLPGRNVLQTALSWRPLVSIGTFAYSLYLVHFPLQQVIWQYLLHPLHLGFSGVYWGMILLSPPLCVAFAYLFFLRCEKPFMNTRPKPPVNKEPLALEPPIVAA